MKWHGFIETLTRGGKRRFVTLEHIFIALFLYQIPSYVFALDFTVVAYNSTFQTFSR